MAQLLWKCLRRPVFCLVALTMVNSTVSAQQACQPYTPPSNCVPSPGGTPYYGPAANPTIPPYNMGMGEGAGMNAGTGEAAPSFGNLAAGADVGSSAALAAPAGYLDNPIPKTMWSLRYDGEFATNRFDRAEYMYGAWQELGFHAHGIRGQNGSFQGTFFDPHASGPEEFPGELNAEVATAAMEYAFKNTNNRLSVFLEVPTEFLNFTNQQEEPDRELTPAGTRYSEPGPENTNEAGQDPAGLADIRFGFKYALIADPDQYLTFQGRIYAPTGNAARGLGTGHWSLEPSLLYYQRLSDRIELQGQFTDWIPVLAGPEAGNVLQYGASLGYTVFHNCNCRVTPLVEVVGWTVLSGLESVALPSGELGAIPVPAGITVPTSHGVQEAAGDTIVNVKVGVRTYFGERSDLYVGYGHSVTGDRWYKDIVTAEYRFSF